MGVEIYYQMWSVPLRVIVSSVLKLNESLVCVYETSHRLSVCGLFFRGKF